MNATLKMWEVPKGLFDSAMKRLGQAFGEGFGSVVERLNKDKDYAAQMAEDIKEPDKAFVRQLIKRLGTSMTLEQVQESISMQCSRETDHLFDRALRRAQQTYPRLVEPFGVQRWNFLPYALGLIEENHGGGSLAIHYLILELGIRRSIVQCLDTHQEQPYDWSLLDTEPATPTERQRLLHKFWAQRPCMAFINEVGLNKLVTSMDQLNESAWEILKYEAHCRRPQENAMKMVLK